ncbi:DNA polymerase IV [Propionispora vibrioides]|jgi:DNA polymerase-4|uniref:DNA polymerase IV n=1 Tax=Propionispora vibrioides TaxID=112903 RepID=A0A1H8WZQ5_9FIRM|nr:DNA polymerase IV [Propionispora vibrioides]SEP33152.1 DNA polymerase-4 [Propionispora vibrioides]
MTQQRWIIHADMDAFYASVEQRDHPEYQGKPVIVGGKSNRGVVAAASYEARQYGVHSAMPIMEAKRRCPQGIYVVPQISKYAEISARIVHIFADFSPRIETLALDEAFLDVTGMELLYGDVMHIARQIKSRVYAELGLIVSVGVAVNKFLAKLASAHRKPDGLVIIRPGEELDFLAPLPVSRLWGVGEVTEKKLKLLQVDSVGKLRQIDPYTLERTLGKAAIELYNLAWGRDERPVIPDREAKSIGNEDTFETDIEQPDEIRTKLLDLAERVGWRVRKEGLAGKTITLKVRFSSFRTITRSVTLQDPVALDEVIYEIALQLMDKIIVKEGIRLLGVSVSNFSQRSTQLCLFNEVTEKREKIASTMDELKERFGTEIVKRGRLF